MASVSARAVILLMESVVDDSRCNRGRAGGVGVEGDGGDRDDDAAGDDGGGDNSGGLVDVDLVGADMKRVDHFIGSWLLHAPPSSIQHLILMLQPPTTISKPPLPWISLVSSHRSSGLVLKAGLRLATIAFTQIMQTAKSQQNHQRQHQHHHQHQRHRHHRRGV